jgi:hypothetical protein
MSTLSRKEVNAIKRAESLDDESVRRSLRECASFAHHGFTRPEDLRELAALSLVLARRQESTFGMIR